LAILLKIDIHSCC